MTMIIAGGGAASIYTGSGTTQVAFNATGTGRQTSASIPTTILPIQQGNSCSGGTNLISVPLTTAVTAGDFLAACIPLTGGASVVSITDQAEGYDAIVAGLSPVGWWKMNELTGTLAYDSGSGDNNGVISGAVILGEPGPIVGTPSDTSFMFSNTTSVPSLQGFGLNGSSLLGGSSDSDYGQVQIAPATDIQFGTNSFSIVGWVNGTTSGSVTGYIFNNAGTGSGAASIATGPLGWAIRGMGIVGGGLFKSGGNAGFALQMNPGTNQFEFEINDADGNSIALETPLSYANSWHMVVGVVDRTAEVMHIYVDGMLIGTNSVAAVGSVTNPSTTPTMGNGIIGDMAQVFLANYALTSSQILGLYEASFSAGVQNRWIQAAYSYNSGFGTEIWYARGAKPGQTVVNITLSTAAQCCANVSEWSGVWYVDPLDQWSQNYGNSAVAATQGVTPRVGSDLFLAVVSADATLASSPSSGYTQLVFPGVGGLGAGYLVSPFDVAESTSWTLAGSSVWATCHASFVPGQAGLNPDFQFPETLVEISTTNNYQQPLEGLGVWTNLSQYVRQMTLGPIGRQHMLDRVQASTASFTVNNRTGQFNPWNNLSTYYNSGFGLKPMNPIKVSASWLGQTSPVFYGYLQAVTPQITDVLNVDVEIAANDILAMLSLKYLSSNVYAQLVIADGEAG